MSCCPSDAFTAFLTLPIFTKHFLLVYILTGYFLLTNKNHGDFIQVSLWQGFGLLFNILLLCNFPSLRRVGSSVVFSLSPFSCYSSGLPRTRVG